MNLHKKLLILLFPNVYVVIVTITAITVKMKAKYSCFFSNLGKIVEYSSKVLDDKISQMFLVAGCWGFQVI